MTRNETNSYDPLGTSQRSKEAFKVISDLVEGHGNQPSWILLRRRSDVGLDYCLEFSSSSKSLKCRLLKSE